MQTVSYGDSLHEMPNFIFWENEKKIPSICRLLNLPMVCQVLYQHKYSEGSHSLNISIFYCDVNKNGKFNNRVYLRDINF